MAKSQVDRRRWLQWTTAAVAAPSLLGLTSPVARGADTDDSLSGRLLKTLKVDMIGVDGSLTQKFAAAKEAGFQGVEMNSPGMNVEETLAAIQASGLPVDGTVCSTHWNIRHTSPDEAERAKALEDLKLALRDTRAVGGHTVLLVVGRGRDGAEEEIWKRSLDNISKALPLAAELGVWIAIENVWNQFLYVHDGPDDQTAERFVQYVDQFNSPWVGMQFDIGNHWKYGDVGAWIRQLGKRIVKLDVKGFSRARNEFTKIGDDDINWADVRRALQEINFYGWCAAEVGGGGPERLREISSNMDKVFKLA